MEPIYEYQKGKGWVAYSQQILTYTLCCDTHVRLERRAPRVNEYYIYTVPRGETIEEKMEFREREYCLSDFSKRIDSRPEDFPDRTYYTVIPEYK